MLWLLEEWRWPTEYCWSQWCGRQATSIRRGPDWLECHGFVLDKGLAIGVI
ncbi:MAG: hypothetical protein GY889_04055 [Proteobacteria bacterium]|nr:hypothetical protein [Pseudomonadota bacterium]